MTEALPRTPEPELMDSPAQVDAYAAADFADSNQWFVDELARNLDGPGTTGDRLTDLGCGPGDVCIRAAGALPGWGIEGADADALVARYAGDEPEVLRTDFLNRLHATWRADVVREQLRAARLPLDCESVSDPHWMVSGRIGPA